MLAAALVMAGAGGAVAVADPDSSNSAAPGDGGTTASGQGSTLGSGGQPGQQPSAGPKNPKNPKKEPGGTDTTKDEKKDDKKEPGGTDTKDEKEDSDLVAAVPDPDAAVPNVVPVTDVVGPVTDVVAPVTDVVGPVPEVVAPVPDVVGPVPEVVAPVPEVVAPVPGVVVDGLGGIDGAGLPAAADASVASQLPRVGPFTGVPGVPAAGNTTAIEPPGRIAPSTLGATNQEDRASSLPGMAPLAANGVIPEGVRSFFRHAYSKLSELPLPVAVSLSALAAVALPGAGGLVILTLAGVRIGYRQAKAGFVVGTTGIARFARPGQLGIVRPMALRVVHPMALRVRRPGVLSAGDLLDEVA